MAVRLEDYRLIFVAPALAQTAVGDYSEDFITAVRPHFGEVVEHRTEGPGLASVKDLRRHRRAVAELVAQGPPSRVLVHAEISTGVLGTFWAVAGVHDVPVTATVHDPPQGVWMPARTKFVARHRLLTHGIHYPLRPVSRALEGVANGQRTLFALTEIGRRSIESTYPRTHSVYVPHLVRDRPVIRPPEQRPKAVGFFGLVYRGKGFEQIARIRAQLPDDILIRVAGRGTEELPAADGIDIVGGVDGPEEDAFFDSIRAVVVPYGKRHFYADTFPASGVVAHAIAYRTPVVGTAYGSLAELDAEHGALMVRGADDEPGSVATALATAISSLVNDEARLTELGNNAERTREERSAARTAEVFAATWSEMLTAKGDGSVT